MAPRPTVLSVCAGVEMLGLGLRLAVDARTVCFVEREIASAEILAARMSENHLDDAPIWSDLTSFDGRPWRGLVDIVAGGIPCQPFSSAGKQLGNDDDRALAPHLLRVVGECLPSVVFVENVPAWVLCGHAREFISRLSDLGYSIASPFFARAQAFGAPHRRERVFIMAHTANVRSKWNVRHDDPASEEGSSNTRRPFPYGPIGPWETIDRSMWPAIEAGTEPALRRVANGHSNRVDRLRAAGNGVVPVVVAHVFRSLLSQFERMNGENNA